MLKNNLWGQFYKVILIALFMILCLSTIVTAQGNMDDLTEKRYSLIYEQWMQADKERVDGVNLSIAPSQYSLYYEAKLLNEENSSGYGKPVAALKRDASVSFEVDVPIAGLYEIAFDYFITGGFLTPPEGFLTVNGSLPYFEARRILFPSLWMHESFDFQSDRHGNEVMPPQIPIKKWQHISMEDASHIQSDPLLIHLSQGQNTIGLTITNGEMLLGDTHIFSSKKPVSYNDYINNHTDKSTPDNFMLIQEAEKYSYKNSLAINPVVSRDLEVTPYDTNRLLLNTLGGSSWRRAGQRVYYTLEIPEDGLYRIGFRYLQDLKPNARVFRTITINGEIPFEELKNYAFEHTQTWDTEILGNDEEYFLFYLEKGKNVLGIESEISINGQTIELLNDALRRINDLSIYIRKLVGNDPDRNRDWVLTDYLPDIKADLEDVAQKINDSRLYVLRHNGDNINAEALILMNSAVRLLLNLASEPNRIPFRLNQLSGEIGSAAQTISMVIQDLENQPLVFDQVFVFSKDEKPPERSVNLFTRIFERLKRLMHSFTQTQKALADDEAYIDVWVNRPRFFVDILQKMADESFTPQSGVRVKFSLMPNEQRLILANASGTAPDVALGISNAQPYELGIRGAALNLRELEGFNELIKEFSPGALLPMIADQKVYGLPETQDFFVLFYRKDIFEALDIPVPDTWEDVKEILPELQRHGMNFYSSMASFGGYKPFMATAPYIFQYGGEMFSKDGMRTAIYEESALRGIRLMTELFTIFGKPKQVPSFFQQLRDGTLPLGIGTFYTYVQLLNAAPELRGSWAIAPSPGVELNGQIVRWQPGTGQTAMIFKSSERPDESWDFLKWWLSSDIQANFAHRLITFHGEEFMWNTANIEAFKQLPWASEDKEVILEQWRWLREVPRIPGSYMLERELSNIWSRVVFDNVNIRSAVDDAVIRINREITRKMEEFGYIENGRMIIPYAVPTIEEVKSWIEGVE